MKRKLMLTAITMVIVAVGCASVIVDSDYDKGTDFANYKTYNWVEGFTAPLEETNPILHKHIVNLIEVELLKKGYQKSDSPDLAIAYTTTSKERQDISTQTTYYSRGFYRDWWYDPHWRVGMTTTRVDTYTEGTLLMGFFDYNTEKLVWRGWATATLRDQRDLDKVDTAIRDLIARFPPGKEE